MTSNKNTARLLGIAFLLQFITSFTSGVFIREALITDGDISDSMMRIADNVVLMRTYILLDMLTALGVVFLGAVLFTTLRKQNEPIALVAFGFYVIEAALLSTSRMGAFALLRVSQEFVSAGQPDTLRTMGAIALDSMDFAGATLHILAFCPGAILFYALLDKSRIVPRILSLWGLITVIPLLVGTITGIFGYELPFALYVPYVPFEFVMGIWLLVKGMRETLQVSES